MRRSRPSFTAASVAAKDDHAWITKVEAGLFLGWDRRTIGELANECFFTPDGLATPRTTKHLLRLWSIRQQQQAPIAVQISEEGGSI